MTAGITYLVVERLSIFSPHSMRCMCLGRAGLQVDMEEDCNQIKDVK
jgi:hypothetical protein